MLLLVRLVGKWKMENTLLQHHTNFFNKFSKSNKSNQHTVANHIEITKVTKWHERQRCNILLLNTLKRTDHI